MSELNERRWAVASERGREESGLSYGEAAQLVARLRAERLSGLCVITDEAAAHLHAAQRAAARSAERDDGGRAAADNGPKPRRGRKKKAS